MAAPPPVGYVRVSSSDPPVSVVARLDETRPDVSSGYGGWDEIERPRRSPLTTFKGSPPLHLTLGLLLDGFAAGTSVEAQISSIEKLARPTGANRQPPLVKIAATGGAVPHTERTWLIGELTWGDALMNTNGNRTRQQVQLVLYEYVADAYLTEVSAAVRRRAKAATKKPGAGSKRVTSQKGRPTVKTKPKSSGRATDTIAVGEDLLSLAARELGDANRWVEIAQLNGMRDPRAVTVGQVIRLP